MSLPGRERASFVLLLVLALGLAAAAVAGAAAAQDVSCCPMGAESARGCTFLGSADCCPERPSAPSHANATPPAPPFCSVAPAAVFAAPPVAFATDAPTLPSLSRTTVLRL
jgi:hypothetical protein